MPWEARRFSAEEMRAILEDHPVFSGLLVTPELTATAIHVPPEDYRLSNLFVLCQDILQRHFESQVLTMGAVYLALGLVLLAIFRSPRIAVDHTIHFTHHYLKGLERAPPRPAGKVRETAPIEADSRHET